MEILIKCRKCNQSKSENDFYLSQLKKHDFLCKECCKIKTNRWYKAHPKKRSDYQRKYNFKRRMENPNRCVICGTVIPYGSRQHTPYRICSENCRKIRSKKQNKKYKIGISKWFKKFKEEQGCAICGYNICGDALVYHHVESKLKERRVERVHLWCGSEKILNELDKCMLLCKNCHAEVHYKERNGDVL